MRSRALWIVLFSFLGCHAPDEGEREFSNPDSHAVRRELPHGLAIGARVERAKGGEAGSLRAIVSIEMPEGASAKDAGLPGFIVQVDPPPGVELRGERVTEFDALKQNEFLMEPWERLVTESRTEIEFGVAADIDPDATLGIVVCGYVTGRAGSDDAFVRQRLEVAVRPGAIASVGEDRDSSWGPFETETQFAQATPLRIGDSAPPFAAVELPSGEAVHSSALLGSGMTLIATYRGYW